MLNAGAIGVSEFDDIFPDCVIEVVVSATSSGAGGSTARLAI